jgi:trigger factor
VGLSAGEEKKFDLTFPEDFANTSLRGQVAHVEVKCKEIKRRNLPEWSDELAKAVGDFESLDDLQKRVREDLQSQAEAEANRTYANTVVEELVAASTVKYPAVLLEHQLDDLMQDLDDNLQQRQRMKLEDYIKIKGQTMEEFRNENRERAEASLKRTLVLTEVIEREGLTVETDEVNGRAELLEAQLGATTDAKLRQALASDRFRSSLALDVLTDKVYTRLVALAKGEDIPLPPAAEETPAAATMSAEPVAEPPAEQAPAEEKQSEQAA